MIPVTAKILTTVIPIILLVNVLLLLFMSKKWWFVSKKWQLSRVEGVILLVIYAIFVALQFI